MTDNNDIHWVCPKCGFGYSAPKGTKPNNDGHCKICPGILVETKYVEGNFSYVPGYEQVSREQVYEEYVYNNEQYDPELIAEWDRRIRAGSGVATKPKEENKPKCPTCGSSDIVDINTLERGISVGLFGLFSGKLGKTMKCNNCGYKW